MTIGLVSEYLRIVNLLDFLDNRLGFENNFY